MFDVYVVVQIYPWFNFDFFLFFSMLIWDNEYETKEHENGTKNKIEPQHIIYNKELFVVTGWGGFHFN